MAALALMTDDLMEEFFLRLPPSDPASLVRAALVCKEWRRILASRSFRRRFRELHRTPPMLGCIYQLAGFIASRSSTSSFRRRPRNADEFRGWFVLDSRHGRVLLARLPFFEPWYATLAVWNPMTGEQLGLPQPRPPQHSKILLCTWNVAVLCASSVCDHLNCHRGPFLIVLAGTTAHKIYVYVYSSEAGAWSQASCAAQHPAVQGAVEVSDHHTVLSHSNRSALVANALYFLADKGVILKYDLGTREIGWLCIPPDCHRGGVLTTSEDGGRLGFAAMVDARLLYLWSTMDDPQHQEEHSVCWAQSRVIELETMLPANVLESWAKSRDPCRLICFMPGHGVFLMQTFDGLVSVDLKCGQVTKVRDSRCIHDFVPYMSFCTPVLGAPFTGEGTSAGASSA